MSTPVLERPPILTEVTVLEGDGNPGEGCEASHKVTKCTGEAAYRIVACTSQTNVCAPFVETPEVGLIARRERGVCARCKRRAVDCWSYWPI